MSAGISSASASNQVIILAMSEHLFPLSIPLNTQAISHLLYHLYQTFAESWLSSCWEPLIEATLPDGFGRLEEKKNFIPPVSGCDGHAGNTCRVWKPLWNIFQLLFFDAWRGDDTLPDSRGVSARCKGTLRAEQHEAKWLRELLNTYFEIFCHNLNRRNVKNPAIHRSSLR